MRKEERREGDYDNILAASMDPGPYHFSSLEGRQENHTPMDAILEERMLQAGRK